MATEKLPWKVITLTSLGGALELYDFMIFAFLAPVLGKLFFPSESSVAEVLHVFIIFGIGYLARPIGGIFYGYFGDKHGRKKTLVSTIMTMAIPTFLIGLLPTVHNIGLTATILLCALRILQGFAMGGEIPGAIVFLVESVTKKRGLACGFIFFGLNIGMLFGSFLVAGLSNGLTHAQLLSWGWRIPFLLGGFLGVVCYYLRKTMHETPLFESLVAQRLNSTHPATDVFKTHGRTIVQGIGLACLGAAFYSFYFYMPTYFNAHLPNTGPVIIHGLIINNPISLINSLGIFVFSCSILLTSFLSDILGRRTMITIGILGFVLLSIPIYAYLFQNHPSYVHILIGEIILSTLGGMMQGTFPCLLSEIFPTSIRYSGFAIAYNLAFAFITGLSPMLVTLWATRTLMAPAYYLMIAAVICLSAVLSMKRFYLTENSV